MSAPVSSMKVAELKTELQHRGLLRTGKKADLASRLEAARDSGGAAASGAPATAAGGAPAAKRQKSGGGETNGGTKSALSKSVTKATGQKLTAYAKSLAAMVNADWHDSYEETGELINEYLAFVAKCLKAVYRICVRDGQEPLNGNEILKSVADSYANMLTVPMRGSVEDAVSDSDVSFNSLPKAEHLYLSNPPEAAQHIWQHLLRAAARGAAASDADLNRMIKDAVDNGADVDFEEVDEEGEGHVVERLQAVYAAQEWAALKTTGPGPLGVSKRP
jgi:hypothetical protein